LELQIETARELVQDLYNPDKPTEAVLGHLIAIASSFNAEAKRQAEMQEEEVPESIEKIEKEIREAVTIEYPYREDEVLDLTQLQNLSDKVTDYSVPGKLQTLIRQNGSKIESIISVAFAGTEVMTEGSSEEEAGPMG